MVRLAPLIVTVPGPPDKCVNDPAPLVDKFPATLRLTLFKATAPEPAKVRLLKLLVPEPPRTAAGPVKVAVLVAPLKVPLLVQFPPKE